MFTTDMPALKATKYFGPATVLDSIVDENLLLLKLNKSDDEENVWAKLAVPDCSPLGYGDIVLAAGENENEIYVIGILKRSIKKNSENKIMLSNGAYTTITKNDNHESLELHSESGELIFSYDSATGKSLINLQTNLDIVSTGDINFISEKDIKFKSGQAIEMESLGGIKFSVKDSIGKILSSLSFRHTKTKLSSSELQVTSQRAELEITDSKFIGNSFSATFKFSKIIAGKLEQAANEIIIKAKNVYETVEELTQLKAGRMRTIIKSTLHIKSKNSYIRSEEDFKVNADKIHLG